jgi:ribonuclease HII
MNELYDFDIRFKRENNVGFLIGVDEAGRGPLAGPVVVAAVVLDLKKVIEGVNDSKILTENKREKVFPEIIDKAIAKKVIAINESYIDRMNILKATFAGMLKCVEGWLDRDSVFILVDGNLPIPKIDKRIQLPLVKGDAKSASVAAASILAKVTRDQMMKKYARDYPQYNFEKHKGYGTKEHIEVLKRLGPCAIHRKTFCSRFIEEPLII